ncbi:MAG: TIGR03118 family protein [Acidobacteriaceae bacterium]
MYRAGSSLLGALVFLASPSLLSASDYAQKNLVSNTPGLAAVTDPNLVNPWGVAFSANGPFWISDQVTALSTLYNGLGTPSALVVSVPGGVPPNNGPTGQVFNTTSGFLVGGKPASFIFDTQGGTINAWNGGTGTTAPIVSSTPTANYTGLALAKSGGANYLYAADSTGQIRVFDSAFNQVTSTTFAGKFVDPALPAGYVPFNIQLIGSNLYVTYAGLAADGSGLPGGVVDIFNTDGTFSSRFSSGGPLYAPWGLTLAPSTFGGFGGDLLVGNFGNGEINAFNPVTGTFLGTLDGEDNQPLVNESLWFIGFRTGGVGVDTNALYFTAGLADESGGLFGAITPSPEPTSLILTALGVISLGVARLRGRMA